MSARPILLDTCAMLFLDRDELLDSGRVALEQAQVDGTPVMVSPITAWELGMLVKRGRIALSEAPDRWFNGFLEAGADLAPMSPEVLVASSFLPGPELRDPADRILAATARAFGYRLMTRDRPLLAVGEAGHLLTIPC